MLIYNYVTIRQVRLGCIHEDILKKKSVSLGRGIVKKKKVQHGSKTVKRMK